MARYTSHRPASRRYTPRTSAAPVPSARWESSMIRRAPRVPTLFLIAVSLGCASVVALAATPGAPTPAPAGADLHAWEGGDDPAALDRWVHGHLQRADAAVARLLAVKGTRTAANTLRPYDEAVNELVLATAQAAVLYGVGAT